MDSSSRALSPQARRVLEQYKDTPPHPTVKQKDKASGWLLSKARKAGQRGRDLIRVHPAPPPLPDGSALDAQPPHSPPDDLPSFAPAISPLLSQRAASSSGWSGQQSHGSASTNSASSGDSTAASRDRGPTSAPTVDYFAEPTSRLLGLFHQPLESRYRAYWQQSYAVNARRGIAAAVLLSAFLGLLNDANQKLWRADAQGGASEFYLFLALRLGGLCIVLAGLALFRVVEPGAWGYSVWPRWSVPVHNVSVLFVLVVWTQANVGAAYEARPGDASLDLSYSLLLILIPSQCATLLHVHSVPLAVICAAMLLSSIVMTFVYTTPDLVLLVVYAVAVICSHVVYIWHAHRESRRNRQEFLSFYHLQQEEEVNQRLLLKMLPLSIIHKLRGGAEYVYEKYERVSVLFSHIDDFDLHTASMQPIQLVRTLNKLFSLFDALTDEHRVYKVETIGDVFLVSSGCPAEYARDDHASALCVLAVDMMAVVKAFKVRHDEGRRTSIRLLNALPTLFARPSVSATLDDDRTLLTLPTTSSSASAASASASRLSHSSFDLRIGINTGPVIAGVVGVKYPRYRLMGDTINTASRMSTTCERGEIQLSAATHSELNSADFVCQQRSRVEVKGKGLMQTYILNEHRLSHRTSATKVVQALGVQAEQAQQQSAKQQHLRAPSMAAASAAQSTSASAGQSVQPLSKMRPTLLLGDASKLAFSERRRKVQQAIDAATQNAHETLAESPLLRPAMKKVSSFFAQPLAASADVSPLLSNDGGLRVMSAYSGQDELANTIRAKSAQVVHLVPAAHRMSVSTNASSEVDNERMLQSAPVSAAHSREASQLQGERHLTTHVYPASAPLTPHESAGAEHELSMALLLPVKPERALTESLANKGAASTATTNTDTRSSIFFPTPSNSSLPFAHTSTHSSSHELSSLQSTSADPAFLLALSDAPSRSISSIISSAPAALAAPIFAAPPLASLAGVGALHPKASISSTAQSSTHSQSGDLTALPPAADVKRSPFLSSRTASSFLAPDVAASHVDRVRGMHSQASFESLSTAASSTTELRESARGSVIVATAAGDALARPNGSVSHFATSSTTGDSHTGPLLTPDMSPRDAPRLNQPADLPALVIPHAFTQSHAHRDSAGDTHLASTPSSDSSAPSPVSTLPRSSILRAANKVSGQVLSADVNQSVHPSHLANSGIDFSPNTHYRFLLPSPSQLPRDVRQPRVAPSSFTAPAATLSSRARQANADDNSVLPVAANALTHSPSAFATRLGARDESNASILLPSTAADSAAVPSLAAALAPGLSTNRRRQRDVVITAHSQRVKTARMFTYGDADALLHPPRPWLAKLSLSFVTDPQLEAEFQGDREAEGLRKARFWTYVTLAGLVCSTVYEEAVYTRSAGQDAAVWLLRLLSAACSVLELLAIRNERWRAWRQRSIFLSATAWCCTFVVNGFLQASFLQVYGLSVLLFSFSIVTMFTALQLPYAVLSVLLSLLCWLLTGLAVTRTVSPLIGLHLAASCLYLGSSYSSEYRDRASFLRFRRHANEMQTTQNFLANLLPPSVIRSLTLAHSAFIAHERLMADVLFCDVVQFTALAARSSPEDVVAILNVLFSSFDAMTDKYMVYKVETIGDAYLACSGVVEEHADHTKLLVDCGLAMRRVTRLFRTPDHQPIVVRIGIHSGFVIAGVVGRKMPRYHLFGETVSIAEEMEQRAPPGQVIISESTLRGMTAEQCRLFDFAPLEPLRITTPSVDPKNAVGVGDGDGMDVRLIQRYMVRSARSAQLQRDREGKQSAAQPKRRRMTHARSHTMTHIDRALLSGIVSGGAAAAVASSGDIGAGAGAGGGGAEASGVAVPPLQRANTLRRMKTRGSSWMDSEYSSLKESERGKVMPGTATNSTKSSARDEVSVKQGEAEERKV